MSVANIEAEAKVALKAGNSTRLGFLRGFINQVRLVAKNDGNREVRDDDVIIAGNKLIKQARETRSFLADGDERAGPLDAEIATIEEFLPKKMSRDALQETIAAIVKQDGCPEGKAARGYVMKTLNADYRGEFESKDANEILSEMI